jgi:hypothetical protein
MFTGHSSLPEQIPSWFGQGQFQESAFHMGSVAFCFDFNSCRFLYTNFALNFFFLRILTVISKSTLNRAQEKSSHFAACFVFATN